MSSKQDLGMFGEEYACDYLIKENFNILMRNYRFSRLGEIDIVALRNNELHFFEVKTRSNERYGSPAQAVNKKKQLKIEKTALIFCMQNNFDDYIIRFDVIEIINTKENTWINVIWDAFH